MNSHKKKNNSIGLMKACRLSLYQQALQMCQRDVFMVGAARGGIDEEARAETGGEIKTV